MNFKEDLISLVVTSYNCGEYLAKCLDSIAEQTYRNLEIILVEDGSTDGSAELCDDFARNDARARVIHTWHGGVAKAKNAGLDAVSGEFFLLVDGDDYFHHDLVRTLQEAITSGPGYDVAAVGWKMTKSMDENVTCCEKVGTQKFTGNEYVERMFHSDARPWYISHWNKLYRTSVAGEVRFGDYPRHIDFDYNYKVFLSVGRAVYVPQIMYYWVQRNSSLTHQKNAWSEFYWVRTEISYKIYQRQKSCAGPYFSYGLNDLYRKMILWKELVRGTEEATDVYAKCREYEMATRSDLLRCKGISLPMRLGLLVLANSPSFVHLLAKMTHNSAS